MAISASPARAAADEGPLALSAPQLRNQCVRCGNAVGGSGSSASQFSVRDPARVDGQDSRIVTVFVYLDHETAAMAHVRAHDLAEHHVNTEVAFSQDHGPQLIAGYSGSLWRYNVALVESTQQTLDELSANGFLQQQASDAQPEAFNLGFAEPRAPQMVDSDFVNCLEQTTSPVVAEQSEVVPAALLLHDLGSGQG